MRAYNIDEIDGRCGGVVKSPHEYKRGFESHPTPENGVHGRSKSYQT